MKDEDDGWTEELPWLGQYVLDENGDAVPAKSLLSWGRWLEDHVDEHRLGDDRIGNARVSTVFLGIDYGWLGPRDGDYKPKLWETMIFGGLYDLYRISYTSRADALEGHRKCIQMLTN